MSSNTRNILIGIVVIALVGAGIYFVVQRQQAAAARPVRNPARSGSRRGHHHLDCQRDRLDRAGVAGHTYLWSQRHRSRMWRSHAVKWWPLMKYWPNWIRANWPWRFSRRPMRLRIQQLTEDQRARPANPAPPLWLRPKPTSRRPRPTSPSPRPTSRRPGPPQQQAQAQKAQLLAGASPGQIAAGESQVAQAREQQRLAQETYNRTIECVTFTPPGSNQEQEVCPGLGAPEEQARAALESATLALRAAEAQLADTEQPRPARPTSRRPTRPSPAPRPRCRRRRATSPPPKPTWPARAPPTTGCWRSRRMPNSPFSRPRLPAPRPTCDLADLRLHQAQLHRADQRPCSQRPDKGRGAGRPPAPRR